MKTTQHTLFVVGRIWRGERRLVFVRTPPPPPFPGPWELCAVVAS
jgi:hypothetical protein